MSIKTEVVQTIVNEILYDSYGRVYGRILGFSADAPASTPLIWIEQPTGGVTSCPSSEIAIDRGRMIVNTSWAEQATRLRGDILGLLRKLSALDALYATHEIVKDAYDAIRADYETTLQALTQRQHRLSQLAKERSDALATAVRRLEELVATSKLEHALKYLEDDAAHLIADALRDGLRRARTEKQEADATIDALAEVSLPPETSAPPTAPRKDAPSAPILLRIHEASL